MTTEYIVVIGTDKTEFDTPLAGTFSAIAKALGKKARIFVATKTGTYEIDCDDRRPSPSTECARLVLSSLNAKSYRLLLFDASSIGKECNPQPALVVWRTYYLSLCLGVETKTIWIDKAFDFFQSDIPAVWWTGLTIPSECSVRSLVSQRWENEMQSLAHDRNHLGEAR